MKKRIHVPWPEEWKKQIHLSTQGTNLIYTPKDFIISFSLYIITVIACTRPGIPAMWLCCF